MILLYSFEGISSKRNSGDSCEDTPVPMPNTEVKLTNAESTWLEAAREDRKLLIKEKTLTNVGVFFSYAGASYPDGLPGIGGEHLLKVI